MHAVFVCIPLDNNLEMCESTEVDHPLPIIALKLGLLRNLVLYKLAIPKLMRGLGTNVKN
jgi:hypothetical protein